MVSRPVGQFDPPPLGKVAFNKDEIVLKIGHPDIIFDETPLITAA